MASYNKSVLGKGSILVSECLRVLIRGKGNAQAAKCTVLDT